MSSSRSPPNNNNKQPSPVVINRSHQQHRHSTALFLISQQENGDLSPQQQKELLYQQTKMKLNTDIDTEEFFAVNGRLRLLSRRFIPFDLHPTNAYAASRNNPFGIDMKSDQMPSSITAGTISNTTSSSSPSPKRIPKSADYFPYMSAAQFCLRYSVKKIPFGGVDGTEAFPTHSDLTNGISFVKKFLQHKLRRQKEEEKITKVVKVLRPALCVYIIKRRARIEKLVKKWASLDTAKSERDVAKRIQQQQSANTNASSSPLHDTNAIDEGFLAMNQTLVLEASMTMKENNTNTSTSTTTINNNVGVSPPRTPRTPGSSSSPRSKPLPTFTSNNHHHNNQSQNNSLLFLGTSASTGSSGSPNNYGSLRLESSMSLANKNMQLAQSTMTITMATRRRIVALWMREQLHYMIKARRSWKKKHAPTFQAAGEFCLYHFGSLLVLPEILKQLHVETPPPIQFFRNTCHINNNNSNNNAKSSSFSSASFLVPSHELFPKLRQMHQDEIKQREEEADKAVRDALAASNRIEMEKLKANVNDLRRKSISGVGAAKMQEMEQKKKLIEEKYLGAAAGGGGSNINNFENFNVNFSAFDVVVTEDESQNNQDVFQLTKTSSSPPPSTATTTTRKKNVTMLEDHEDQRDEEDEQGARLSSVQKKQQQQQQLLLQKKNNKNNQTQQNRSYLDEPFMTMKIIPQHIYAHDERKVEIQELPQYYRHYVESKKPKKGRGIDVLFDFSSVRRHHQVSSHQPAQQQQQQTKHQHSSSSTNDEITMTPQNNNSNNNTRSSPSKNNNKKNPRHHPKSQRDENAFDFIQRSSREDYYYSDSQQQQTNNNNKIKEKQNHPQPSFLPELKNNNHKLTSIKGLKTSTSKPDSYYRL